MKLKEAIIRNFRSIKDVSIEFDPPCRVLVGLNESGKSNILRALALLSDAPSPQDKRMGTADENFAEEGDGFVRFVFHLENNEQEKVRESVLSEILAKSKNPEIAYVDGKKKTVKSFCSLDTYIQGGYEIGIPPAEAHPFAWALEKEAELLAGWCAVSDACPDGFTFDDNGDTIVLSDYTLVRANDYSGIPEEYLEDADIDTLTSILDEAIADAVKNNMPDVRFWEYKKENIMPARVNIEEFKTNPDSCMPLKNMFALAGCNNIATAISERANNDDPNPFRNFLKNIAEKTTKHFRGVWKEYKNIKFSLTASGGEILPSIEEKNTYSFELRSDGLKRFVSFLLLISAAVKTNKIRNTLLLVDEPEISMHPAGARYLRDELIRISKQSQNYVVYSTHSIFMVDPDDVGRHYIVTKENEKTSANPAKGSILRDEEILYKALGFTMYEVYEKQNLIFEGWRDARLFKVALEHAGQIKKEFDGIGVCHARGVKTIESVVATVQLAKREAIIIADGDNAAKKMQTKYNQRGGTMPGGIPFFIYQNLDGKIAALTGEDFVKNDHIAKSVKSALGGMDAPVFDASVLPRDKEKLAAIEKWLNENTSLSGDELSDKMNEIKGAIFNNLEYTDIDMPEYEKLLQGIAKKLRGGKK